MTQRLIPIWGAARLAVSAVLFVALVTQFSHSIAHTRTEIEPYAAHVPTVAWNFFAFFTNQSNILAAAWLLVAAVWALRGRRAPAWLATAQIPVVTFMAITGVVYNVLLRDDPITSGAPPIPWVNEVMHVWGPLFVLLDLLVAPRPRRVRWSAIWIAVAYPSAYVVVTLLRAPFITSPRDGSDTWHPYGFLDPAGPDGVAGVLAHVVGIALAVVAISSALTAVARWRAARAGAPAP